MRRNVLFMAIAAVVTLAQSAGAQQDPIIAGTVTVMDQPIPGAEVVLTNKSTGQRYTFRTDMDGRYVATGIPADATYDIAVTMAGFATSVVQSVLADPAGIAPVDFALTKSTETRLPDRIVPGAVCGGGGNLEPPDTGTSRSPRLTGRDFLLLNAKEASGYGSYSYLLFGSPPGEAETARYESAIRAFLGVLKVKDYGNDYPHQSLNIVYLPVKQPVTDAELVTKIVKNLYDYARGGELLVNLTGKALSSGPYVVSTRQPLSQVRSDHPARCTDTAAVLCQDLSTFPPALVPVAIQLFIEKASQDTAWTETTLPEVALYLRKYIEIAALGLPAVKASVQDWSMFLAPLIGAKSLPGK